jgi:hypothetical protein
MASGAETGATFSIRNSVVPQYFGPSSIGANLGSWSNRYPNVYALDFDSFTQAGTYFISVSGPITAISPNFKIDNGRQGFIREHYRIVCSFTRTSRDGPNFRGHATGATRPLT